MLLANELQKHSAFSHIIDQNFLTNLRQSSPLHDIGKVSVKDNILLKPSRLSPDEYNEMKKHALIGKQHSSGRHIPQERSDVLGHGRHHRRVATTSDSMGKDTQTACRAGRFRCPLESLRWPMSMMR